MKTLLQDFYPDLETALAALPIKLPVGRAMTQDEFFTFCQQNRKLPFERNAKGELSLSPAYGVLGSFQISSMVYQLGTWAKERKIGAALSSSVGYVLPNGANRSPSVSWLSPEQLASLTPEEWEKLPRLCPLFLTELCPRGQDLKRLQAKMDEYMANGCQLGWLIDPDQRQVHVYRPGQPVQVLDNPQTLAGDPELPGFVLDLEPVWRP